MRGDWFGHINQKPSHRGSVLANEMQVGLFLGRGDPIGEGYTGVEVPGGCDWVKCEGGLVWVKNPKTELLGLGFSQQKPGIHLGSPKVGADDVISILLSVSKQQCTSFLPPSPSP